MSEYPRDEFDQVPEQAARQGVHRARLVPPRSSGLGLIILVGILALAVGLAAFFILPRLGLGAAPSPVAAGPTTAPGASGSPKATATPSAKPTASATPSPSPKPAPTKAAPIVDKTTPVTVLNATTVSGLGAEVAIRVSADGWSQATAGNWAGQPLQTSMIFYNGAAQLPSAQALGSLLNIPTLVDSPDFAPNIAVVLGPGFQ